MDFLYEIKQLADRYELAEVYAFGSRAKEIAERFLKNGVSESPGKSDADIGVRMKPGKALSPRKRVQLALDLEDLLGASRVDLVLIPEAEPFLAADIIRGELLYAEDLDRHARYELYVLRRAADLFPFKKERIRMIMEEGAR